MPGTCPAVTAAADEPPHQSFQEKGAGPPALMQVVPSGCPILLPAATVGSIAVRTTPVLLAELE